MIEHEDRECRVKGACAIATLVEDIDASVHAMFTAGGVRPLVSLLLNGVCIVTMSQLCFQPLQ